MLFEYALDPSLLGTWQSFRYFVEKFGVSQGRLISRYPKTWKQMVYANLSGCGDVERKRIEVVLQRIDDRLLKRHHDWNPGIDWLRNAETEHGQRPFRAIVAASNPRGQDVVLEGHALDETETRWQSPSTLIVPRRAADMCAAMALLLQCCSEVVFVDPHFGPENRRHRRPLQRFLAELASPGRCRELKRVELHTGDKAAATFFEPECRRQLASIVPAGIGIRIVRWHRGELHNRLILTDVGGILIGHGLDEQDGSGPPTDDFSRLDAGSLRKHWRDYVAAPTFTFVDEVMIDGATS